MRRKVLEKMVIGYSAAVLIAAIWFWSLQVQSVIDLLRIAYG